MLGTSPHIVAATNLPVNADFESGYAHDPDGVAANVRLCVETGVAGLSIEDATGDPARPLYDIGHAVERIRAARARIDATGYGRPAHRARRVLPRRPPGSARGILRRLEAYAEAGADVLYAPGPTTPDDIRAIVEAVAPKPVNLLVSSPIGLTRADIAALGVRRISVGSALARAPGAASCAPPTQSRARDASKPSRRTAPSPRSTPSSERISRAARRRQHDRSSRMPIIC